MPRRIDTKRLEEFLKKLQREGTANFDGTLVLGESVGDIREGGFFNPIEIFYGRVGVELKVGENRAYEFDMQNSEKVSISTGNQWFVCSRPQPYYATRLRKSLRRIPHLLLNAIDKPSQKYHFAVLYATEHK